MTVKGGGGKRTQTHTNTKGRDPKKVMLRDLTILNPGESINQRIRLPYMSNIGGGSTSQIWKGNVMEYTLTIQPTSMINELKNKEEERRLKKCQATAYNG